MNMKIANYKNKLINSTYNYLSMKLPKLTNKQQEIIKLLYRFRFLNRIQVQALMGHKDYKTINMWLKDLRQKQYIEWIYSTHYAERTKPAIYYLGINGIRYLKTLKSDDDSPAYPLEELRKRYRESFRSLTFIDRCQMLADCCLTLRQDSTEKKYYFYETEADYLRENSYYHFLGDSEFIHPQLSFSLEKQTGKEESVTTRSFLLEIFDATLPRYRVKKRLSNYVEYLDSGDWECDTVDELPIILLVCPRTSDLIYAKRRTRGLIANTWEYDDEGRKNIHIQFSTVEELKKHGVIGEIWEEA